MVEMKLSNKKKMRNTLFIAFIVFTFLLGRIAYIQFVKRQ